MNGPYLLNINFSSYKDALCQVCLKLGKWFLRRRLKCEKFKDRQTDNGRQMIRKAHLRFSSGELNTKSWENKQNKLTKTSKLKATIICQHKMTLLVSGWIPFLLAYSSDKWAFGTFCRTVIWCIIYQLHAVTNFFWAFERDPA